MEKVSGTCLMSEIDTHFGGTNMRKLIFTGIAGLMLLTGSLMLVASAAAHPTSAAGAQKLIVAMRDPGCHWFYQGGGPSQRKYATKVVRQGPVKLLNLDEATLSDALAETYPSALRRAAREAFAGVYTVEQCAAMIDQEALLKTALQQIQQAHAAARRDREPA